MLLVLLKKMIMCSVNLKQNELDTYNDFLNDFYYDVTNIKLC